MGTKHPELEQYQFEKGKEKTGGRQKGTPNRLKPDDIMYYVDKCLREEISVIENNKPVTKKTIEIMINGLRNRIVTKGDPKAMELFFKLYGMLKDNLNLTGQVGVYEIPEEEQEMYRNLSIEQLELMKKLNELKPEQLKSVMSVINNEENKQCQ